MSGTFIPEGYCNHLAMLTAAYSNTYPSPADDDDLASAFARARVLIPKQKEAAQKNLADLKAQKAASRQTKSVVGSPSGGANRLMALSPNYSATIKLEAKVTVCDYEAQRCADALSAINAGTYDPVRHMMFSVTSANLSDGGTRGRTAAVISDIMKVKESATSPALLNDFYLSRWAEICVGLRHHLFSGRLKVFFASAVSGMSEHPNINFWLDDTAANSALRFGSINGKMLYLSDEVRNLFPPKMPENAAITKPSLGAPRKIDVAAELYLRMKRDGRITDNTQIKVQASLVNDAVTRDSSVRGGFSRSSFDTMRKQLSEGEQLPPSESSKNTQ